MIPLLDRTQDHTLLIKSSEVFPGIFLLEADPVIPRLNPVGRLIGAQTQLIMTLSAALCTSAASYEHTISKLKFMKFIRIYITPRH